MGNTFIPWHLHRFILKQAHFLEHTVVLGRDFGSLPSGNLLLLRSSGAAGDAGLGALRSLGHGGGVGARRE